MSRMSLCDLSDANADVEAAPFDNLSYRRCILSPMDVGTDGRCIAENTSDGEQTGAVRAVIKPGN